MFKKFIKNKNIQLSQQVNEINIEEEADNKIIVKPQKEKIKGLLIKKDIVLKNNDLDKTSDQRIDFGLNFLQQTQSSDTLLDAFLDDRLKELQTSIKDSTKIDDQAADNDIELLKITNIKPDLTAQHNVESTVSMQGLREVTVSMEQQIKKIEDAEKIKRIKLFEAFFGVSFEPLKDLRSKNVKKFDRKHREKEMRELLNLFNRQGRIYKNQQVIKNAELKKIDQNID